MPRSFDGAGKQHGAVLDNSVNSADKVLILGAGLAGLTAARQLSRANRRVTVIESNETIGGLAQTVEREGFRFDLGGHRFVTDNPVLETCVREILGDDCLTVSRSSKILLRGRYFDYPLRPLNAISGFGPVMTASILFDYARERLRARFVSVVPVSLEDWVVSRFGRTLFNIYFRDYSEKVWGIDCQRIDMKWMEQRVQGLSLGKAIRRALFPWYKRSLPTLTRSFLYPRLGIGQIAENLGTEIRRNNSILTERRVTRVNHSGNQIKDVEVAHGNQQRIIAATQFISTIPLPALVRALRPHPPADVLAAASQLRSRDLVTVNIMLNRPRITDLTWIYVPEKSIPFGRIHEPTNWSPCMAPPGQSLLVTEYFCFRGDAVWGNSDEALAECSISNLVKLGFIKRREVIDYAVLRIANAYPLFECGYSTHCQTIYDYLNSFRNLYTAGRGGMFRYYNMDHAMQTGMNVAQDIIQHSSPVPDTSEATGVCA
ncbi:MAG: FAD-dependent oxidoreductase [Gammaproteobacteria bacterium]